MSHLSDEESSDSSDDFLVSADQINFNSSFFSEKTTKDKDNLKSKQNVDDKESDDESTELDSTNDNNAVEIFSQVLQNLENSNIQESHSDNKQNTDGNNAGEAHRKVSTTGERGSMLSKEIKELLLQGETGTYNDEESSEDDDNLEESQPSGYTIPKEGVKITLPGESLMMHRKKKGKRDLETLLKNRMNQRLKTSQVLVHKVGLLCWLAYGFYLNQQVNDSEVMSIALSLVAMNNYPKGRSDLGYLEKFTKWFKNMFTTKEDKKEESITRESLLCRLKDKHVLNYKELVLLYVATLRAIGLNARLVISLCPPQLTVPKDQLFKTKAEIIKEKEKQEEKAKENTTSKSQKNTTNVKNVKKEENTEKKVIPKNSETARKNANLEARKKAAAILKTKANNKNQSKEDKNKTEGDEKILEAEKLAKRTRSQTQKQAESEETNNKSYLNEQTTFAKKLRARLVNMKEKDDMKSDKKKLPAIVPEHDSQTKHPRKCKQSNDSKPSTSNAKSKNEDYESDEQFDSDEDFVVKHPVKRKLNPTETKDSKSKPRARKYRKLISSDEESDEPEKNKNAENIWAEVYVESEESWICVNVMDAKIHCVAEVYKKATKPVLYVIAWNAAGSIKDVTRRYCPQWLTVTRKKRVDEKWWNESLCPWKEKNTAISRAEDEMLIQKELEQPLPKGIGECKGHPLYVLARHLLKFEALYPPDVVPVGHLPNGEAIYSRHCVHTLCSRETWLKKARVVKPAQEPYKIVKSMPKYDKLSGMKIKDQPLEIFGIWQTTEYVPPEAKDGIVPRNAYGNVDLFKQCMLPKGTVHINLPGLNRVARKLDIDCAPAVVGFNFGTMGAVPAIEGYVVCSEYEDTLREAWEAEQIEAARRAKEKREQRIYGNWKKLIKGLIIRERLAAKYGFHVNEDTEASTSNKRSKHKQTDTKKIKGS